MKSRFGFDGNALRWFKSYLENRVQSVKIEDFISKPCRIYYGVPQGSVLGPLLFSMYIAPIEDIIHLHNVKCMILADDSQMYLAFNSCDRILAMETLRSCINDIIIWNERNKLICNPGKTEIIHFSSRFIDNPPISAFTIGSTDIKLTDQVRDLGVIFDSNLNFRVHINNICRASSLAVRNIGRI